MGVTRTPWPGPGTPSETAIRAAYRAEGLSPYAWSNGPGDRYGVHTHATHKVLYCVQGSIAFLLGAERVELVRGDRLDLPAGTPHGALVGPGGVVCLEAHR